MLGSIQSKRRAELFTFRSQESTVFSVVILKQKQCWHVQDNVFNDAAAVHCCNTTIENDIPKYLLLLRAGFLLTWKDGLGDAEQLKTALHRKCGRSLELHENHFRNSDVSAKSSRTLKPRYVISSFIELKRDTSKPPPELPIIYFATKLLEKQGKVPRTELKSAPCHGMHHKVLAFFNYRKT